MPFPIADSSPLLLHQPTPTPTRPSNAIFPMSPSPARSASPSVLHPHAATPSHQIPFNLAPVHHAPSPLGFGFGFGSSFGNNNSPANPHPFPSTSCHPFPSSSSSSSSSSFFTSAMQHDSSNSPSTKRSETKRRRDADDDHRNDQDEDMDQITGQFSASLKSKSQDDGLHTNLARPAALKKMRVGLGSSPTHLSSHLPPNSQTHQLGQQTKHQHDQQHPHSLSLSKKLKSNDQIRPQAGMSGIDVDIGKMLASMDKSSLLSMLGKLLTQTKDPGLGAQILSLLPAPSLESVETALDELEKTIRSALPFTVQGSDTNVRDEYTWSRLRAPLAAFADAVLGYLPFFVTELESDRQQRSQDRDPRCQASREEVHPATSFSFLHAVTHRVLRIEAMLPPVPKSSLSFSVFGSSRRTTTLFGFGWAGVANESSSHSHTSPQKQASSHQPSSQYSKHLNLADKLPSECTLPASPDALMVIVMPALLNQWSILSQRLDRAVNVDGRMFGQEVVLGWARSLAAIGSRRHNHQSGLGPMTNVLADRGLKPEEIAIQHAMDEVCDRLERDLGWLVGGNGPASFPTNRSGADRRDTVSNPSGYSSTMTPSSSTASQKRSRSSAMDDDEEEL